MITCFACIFTFGNPSLVRRSITSRYVLAHPDTAFYTLSPVRQLGCVWRYLIDLETTKIDSIPKIPPPTDVLLSRFTKPYIIHCVHGINITQGMVDLLVA